MTTNEESENIDTELENKESEHDSPYHKFSDDKDKQIPYDHSITTLAISSALDQKALDVRAVRVSEQTSIADYFVIVSGTSERHVVGIANKIERNLREAKQKPLSVTGKEKGEWVVIDYGDLVVHVFFEPSRQFYNFDELWAEAPPLKLSEELAKQVRKLRTGIY